MAVDWFAPICAYCERQDPGFWAEPANAVSNGAFLLAAVAAAWQVRAEGQRDIACFGLAVVVAVVGIGSFLFHTLAVFWAMLADVIPIAAFVVTYLFLALRRVLGLGLGTGAALALVFAALDIGFAPALGAATGVDLAGLTGGSIDYLPALLALTGVALAAVARGDAASRAAGRRLLGIGGLFLVSLGLRTLDGPACATIPTGTHAVWHILNAFVLYALIVTMLRHGRTVPLAV